MGVPASEVTAHKDEVQPIEASSVWSDLMGVNDVKLGVGKAAEQAKLVEGGPRRKKKGLSIDFSVKEKRNARNPAAAKADKRKERAESCEIAPDQGSFDQKCLPLNQAELAPAQECPQRGHGRGGRGGGRGEGRCTCTCCCLGRHRDREQTNTGPNKGSNKGESVANGKGIRKGCG